MIPLFKALSIRFTATSTALFSSYFEALLLAAFSTFLIAVLMLDLTKTFASFFFAVTFTRFLALLIIGISFTSLFTNILMITKNS